MFKRLYSIVLWRH